MSQPSSSRHLLLFDVGNTNVKLGLTPAAGGPIATYAHPTPMLSTSDQLGFFVREACRLEGVDPTQGAWLASSVVPRLDGLLRRAAARYGPGEKGEIRFAPGELPIALENRYQRPNEVGADRLVTAFAATRLFNAPGYVVIDFGTATTMDCATPTAYLGGLICPGLESAARALASGTAKLPQADFWNVPEEITFATSTSASLAHGFVHGFAAMAEGLVARLRRQMPEGSMVVATGGFAEAIARVSTVFDAYRPDLLLEGLRLAYQLDTDTEPEPGAST